MNAAPRALSIKVQFGDDGANHAKFNNLSWMIVVGILFLFPDCLEFEFSQRAIMQTVQLTGANNCGVHVVAHRETCSGL